MTDKIIKTEDARLVTIGGLKKALKEERVITNDRFAQLEAKMEHFQKSLERFANAILAELEAMRAEHKEFRQQVFHADRILLIHEQKIDEIDTRVLKLETTK